MAASNSTPTAASRTCGLGIARPDDGRGSLDAALRGFFSDFDFAMVPVHYTSSITTRTVGRLLVCFCR